MAISKRKRSLIMWGLWAIIFPKEAFAFFALTFFFSVGGMQFFCQKQKQWSC
jgi:hypothetical protein